MRNRPKPCAAMDCGDSAFHLMGEIDKMTEVVAEQGIERFLRMNFTDLG